MEHYDEADHPGYFTHMIAISDILKSFQPSLFFILYPGIFIILLDFASIIFSGLCKCSTPLITPSGTSHSTLDTAAQSTLNMHPSIGLLTALQSQDIGAVAEKKISIPQKRSSIPSKQIIVHNFW